MQLLNTYINNKTMKKNIFLTLMTVMPIWLTAQIPSYLPKDGLIGWWPFNGNANDESGNGNNGTVNGPTLTSDRTGRGNSAYSFDGVNDFIQVPHNTKLNPYPLSVTCWVKSTSNSAGGIVSKYPDANANNGWSVHSMSGKLSGYYYNFNGGSLVNLDFHAKQSISDSIWHFITIVYSNGNAKIYFDSKIIDSVSFWGTGTPSNSTSNSSLYFGRIGENLGWATFFKGNIDDIAIYNRPLTQQEISALYNGTPNNNGGANSSTSNVPQGITYQAVARNAQGIPISNMNIIVKFTLLADSISGAEEYTETHSVTTSNLGLFNLIFGNGVPIKGSFSNIIWASGNKYIKVEINEGNGFSIMGTQQLMSVPYAQHSNTAKTLINKDFPVYANNAAAIVGGLQAGQIYRTDVGNLMIVY